MEPDEEASRGTGQAGSASGRPTDVRDEFGVLVLRYLDGTATPEDITRLNGELSSNPERRKTFVELARRGGNLSLLLQAARSQPEAVLSSGAADLKFWFCEKCGKRLTDREIATGEARDKKLKGVFCADCAVGVRTVEALPISETEARKILQKSSESRVPSTESKRTSSKRIQLRHSRRIQESSGQRWMAPTLIAACLLVAATISLTVFKREPGQALAREEQARREAIEKQRKAQDELARKEDELRRAREQAARVAAEKKATEVKLAALEAERLRIAEAQKKAVENNQQATEAERRAQEEELARLDAQKQEEEARLAKSAEEQRKAESAMELAEAQRKEAEQKVAKIERKAEDLGQIVFVVDLKGDPKAAPVLIRGGEKQPLTKGTKLLKGDRIETGTLNADGQQPGAKSQEPRAARPVHAALELNSGAAVDLADATNFELFDAAISKLETGLLYAEVSASNSGPGQAAKSQEPRAKGSFTLKTAFADVITESASFDLTVDAKEALLQMEEGTVTFRNASGERALKKLQKSTARKDFAPGAPVTFQPSAAWRGRKGPAASGKNLLADPGFEGNGHEWTSVWQPNNRNANTSGRAVVSGPLHGGAKALQIQAHRFGSKQVYQEVPAEAGEAFEIACWIRSQGLDGQGACVAIQWLNAAGVGGVPGAELLRTDVIGMQPGTRDWTRHAGRFVAPAGARALRLRLFTETEADDAGTAWFDDCAISKVKP